MYAWFLINVRTDTPFWQNFSELWRIYTAATAGIKTEQSAIF